MTTGRLGVRYVMIEYSTTRETKGMGGVREAFSTVWKARDGDGFRDAFFTAWKAKVCEVAWWLCVLSLF
jgi:hypothetical protein